MRSRIGPNSIREPHQGARRDGKHGLVRHVAADAIERRALTGGELPRVGLRRSPHEHRRSGRPWSRAWAGPRATDRGRAAARRFGRCHFGTFAGVCASRERALSPLSAKRSTHSSHPRRATRVDTVAGGRRAMPGRVLRASRPSATTPGHAHGLAPVAAPRARALFTRSVNAGRCGWARWLRSRTAVRRRSGSYRRARKVPISCGGGGIRTLGSLAAPAVFKTAAFDRSATPPTQ